MQKKFQVFISSTYTDLIEERQQAVQAILNANHIPAGMELFKAGSTDQLQTIRRWIDESDIYMLILGGRYGTLEPKSKKSYTHLEFEYALESGKPIFVIVLTDQMLKIKSLASNVKDEDVYEKKNIKKYRDFKKMAAGHNRVVSMVENIDQIKSSVLGSINEIIQLNDLKGWIREENNISFETRQQLQRLTDENHRLYAQINELKKAPTFPEKIGEFTYDEILYALTNKSVPFGEFERERYNLDFENPTLLSLFLEDELLLIEGIPTLTSNSFHHLLIANLVPTLRSLNMIEKITTNKIGSYTFTSWTLNENGRTFLVKIKVGAIDISGHL